MRILRRHDRDTHLVARRIHVVERMTKAGLPAHPGLNRSVKVALLQDHERADPTENETP